MFPRGLKSLSTFSQGKVMDQQNLEHEGVGTLGAGGLRVQYPLRERGSDPGVGKPLALARHRRLRLNARVAVR